MCNYLLYRFAATLTHMGASEMTPAEQFAAWLKQAMRGAGYDIDSQRGGGRNELAAKMGVAKSTVTRWLSGEVLPATEYFQPLAAALNVSPLDMLAQTGILGAMTVEDFDLGKHVSPQQALEVLGLTDPGDQAAVLAVVERLKQLHTQR